MLYYLLLLDNQDDRDKFELLYNTHRKLMLYIAQNILKDKYLAEDAVHQVFLFVIKNFNKIEDVLSNKTKSYLCITTKFTSIKMLKDNSYFQLDENTPSNYSIDDDFISKVNSEETINFILGLKDIYKDVLILKYYNELSQKEMAKILNISHANIRKRLQIARIKVKNFIAQQQQEDNEGVKEKQ